MATIATTVERDNRLSRLRQKMVEHDLDALLIAGKGHWWTGRGYIRYLADFHLWGHDCLILLPLDTEPVMSITSPAVGKRVADRGWITDVRGDFRLVRRIADAVHERHLEYSRIGIVGFKWILPVGMFHELSALLPSVKFSPSDDLFNTVRMIKSPLEIEQNRDLWTVMREAMEAFERTLSPGVTQREATAEACKVALSRGARDILVFIGEDPHDVNPPRDVPLHCSDALRIHLEICGESGHWCERTTMYTFKELNPSERNLQETEVGAFEVVRAAARPGMSLADLSAIYEGVLREQGWSIKGGSNHFDFHGQGLDVIEYPWFSSGDPDGTHADALLHEGQVFSYHPRRPIDTSAKWGPDIHDDILIERSGATRLSGEWDLRWKRMA